MPWESSDGDMEQHRARRRDWPEATQRGKASGSPGTWLIKWRDSHETEDDS